MLSLLPPDGFGRVIKRLEPDIIFDSQVQFDTLTRGRRHIGHSKQSTGLKVELFELFDDPFVKEQFGRRRTIRSKQIGTTTWLPTPEDVIVQKLRWGRSKDLDDARDARDVLAVQGVETLDMSYIGSWCEAHGTMERLRKALAEIPPL